MLIADLREASRGVTRIELTVGARIEETNQLHGLVRAKTAHSGCIIAAQ